MDEFDLIRKWFVPLALSPGADNLLDDVAEIVHGGSRLIATTDAIVEGVHFLPDDPIETVAAKLVRVNVSDIVAKGAVPDGAFLTLVWPRSRPVAGIEGFALRLGEELAARGAYLLGGDTSSTTGRLTLSLTLLGRCGARGPVRRSGASAEDDLWVTGDIGEGWLGLQAARGKLPMLMPVERARLVERYRVPEPPVAPFASVIAAHATASIDVSDGLVADAGHVARASGLALVIDCRDMPFSEAARSWLATGRRSGIAKLLTGGDDYQTLFTATTTRRDAVREACDAIGVKVSRIGRAESGEGVRLLHGPGSVSLMSRGGWRHFGA
ncbi:MAG: thiamine-phosphate kinase [Alphaproteobacteria bacterium]|nr:thiamine-phosphate kinase [Alphaproteobacteria bacterium]